MSPTRAPKLCRTPSCPHPAMNSSYCTACRARLGLTDRPSRTGSHWHNWNTGTSTERGYGAPWRRIREAVLRDAEYLCVPCRHQGRVSLAREVHHLVPRAAGGTDARTNLEARCTDCHRRATAQMRQTPTGGGR
jgi:5-methylcytosine-specific restriction protein A